jgi:hypothetical protein
MKYLFLLFLPALLSTTPNERQQPRTRSSAMHRLTFTLHVIEGDKDQPQNYTLVLEERTSGKIRALTKFPLRSGSETTYVETGIKCDAQYNEVLDGRVRVQVELQYTGPAGGAPITAAPATADAPVLHEWQSRVEATVPVDEVFVLSTYDAGTGRKYQLDVRAEKLR